MSSEEALGEKTTEESPAEKESPKTECGANNETQERKLDHDDTDVKDVEPVATTSSTIPTSPNAAKVEVKDEDVENDDDDDDDDDAEEGALVLDDIEDKSEGGESDEKDFEPSADMLMNDFDDERTLEEEEALEAEDAEENDELSALEQEQDMPLEELLKLYNYRGGQEAEAKQETRSTPSPEPENPRGKAGVPISKPKPPGYREDEKTVINEESPVSSPPRSTSEKRRNPDSPGSKQAKKSRSELAKFYEATVEGRPINVNLGESGDADEDESEDENSETDVDYSWKKAIMIGSAYQACVPNEMSCDQDDDIIEQERKDQQLWDPFVLPEEEVEDFLMKFQQLGIPGGLNTLPEGEHIKDNEQALFTLLQCGLNRDEALRRRCLNDSPTSSQMAAWSEEECRAFELGLRLYGKDFFMVHKQKVRTRSVGELVQFYYLWKKTERHDLFVSTMRFEKKQYSLHPGITDYMERFMNGEDVDAERSVSPQYALDFDVPSVFMPVPNRYNRSYMAPSLHKRESPVRSPVGSALTDTTSNGVATDNKKIASEADHNEHSN